MRHVSKSGFMRDTVWFCHMYICRSWMAGRRRLGEEVDWDLNEEKMACWRSITVMSMVKYTNMLLGTICIPKEGRYLRHGNHTQGNEVATICFWYFGFGTLLGMEEDEKEKILFCQSDISTSVRQLTQKLEPCLGSLHLWKLPDNLKLISDIAGREVIVRDRISSHPFKMALVLTGKFGII